MLAADYPNYVAQHETVPNLFLMTFSFHFPFIYCIQNTSMVTVNTKFERFRRACWWITFNKNEFNSRNFSKGWVERIRYSMQISSGLFCSLSVLYYYFELSALLSCQWGKNKQEILNDFKEFSWTSLSYIGIFFFNIFLNNNPHLLS